MAVTEAERGPGAVSGPEQATARAATAREHKQAGRLALAAAYNHACRRADPAREGLWRQRAEALQAAAELRSLGESQAVRLAVAGIGPDDAGLQALHAWNAQVADRQASR
jgi:hypothetical protein